MSLTPVKSVAFLVTKSSVEFVSEEFMRCAEMQR